jgi:replicative DNA helicase
MTMRMMNVSREFKLMAVSNGIPVVLLTQATMSDKSDVNSPPMIEQVAWSKALQNDADLALAVHKYTDENRFDIIARKNRHGPDFAVELKWNLNTGEYEEVEYETFEAEEFGNEDEAF